MGHTRVLVAITFPICLMYVGEASYVKDGCLLQQGRSSHRIDSDGASGDLPTLLNIGYVLRGYDIMFGNPSATGGLLIDPGYKEPVFEASYRGEQTTADLQWRVPDNISALNCKHSCSMTFDSTEVHGAQSYQQTLGMKVSTEAEGWGAKFSASADYQQVQQGSSQDHYTYTVSEARCCAYSVNVHSFQPPALHTNFRAGLAQLTEAYDVAGYARFIDRFGTHYIASADMGGLYGQVSTISEVSRNSMVMSSLDVKAAASASAYGATGSVSTQSETSKKLAKEFSSKTESQYIYTRGAGPPDDGSAVTWANSAMTSPAPFKLELRKIHNLLDDVYGANVSLAVRSNLERALDEYCPRLLANGQVPSCDAPGKDPPAIEYRIESNTGKGDLDTGCPTGHVAISCGTEALNWAGGSNYELYWKAYPSSNSKCRFYNYFGQKTYTTCVANAFSDVTVVSKEGSGRIDAVCPTGKKALGCGINNKGREKWPEVYPSSSGDRCTCYNYHGLRCFATCAADVKSYRVVKKYGTGHFNVTCPENTFALGCGIRKSGSTIEGWKAYYPSSVNTCTCYNNHGMDCHAICGRPR